MRASFNNKATKRETFMNELMNAFENLSGPGTKTLKKLVQELISESSEASSKWNHTLGFV